MKSKITAAADEVELTDTKGPIVIMPSNALKVRKGKGYSYKEIKASSIPLDDLKKAEFPIDTRRKTLHQSNVDELGTLYRQMTAAGILTIHTDDKKLGHRLQVIRHLRKLPVINKKDAEMLIDGGIYSISDLSKEDPKALAKDLDIGIKTVEKWIESATSIKTIIDAKSTFKKLSRINGIKKKYIKDLLELNINNIDDLLNANAEKVAGKLNIDIDEVLYWIKQIKRMKGMAIEPEIKEEIKPIKSKNKIPVVEKEISEEIDDKLDVEELEDEELKEFDGDKITESTIESETEDMAIDPEEDLIRCKGLGKKTAEKLINSGIFSINDLIEANIEELEKLTGIKKQKIKKFQDTAKQMI